MASQTDQAVRAARRFVRAVQRIGIDLDAAYLYGSYAVGSPTADSDIDIALVSKDLTGGIEDLEKIRSALHAQDSRIENVRFHPRNFQNEHPLVWEIKTKGIPLTLAAHSEKQVQKLNTRRVVAYWRKAARQEWQMAQSFFADRHYSYALAFARGYLENLLKAVIVRKTGTHAPYRQSLSDLADLAEVELNDRDKALLERADTYKREIFEHPEATSIRHTHTRRFTAKELKAIKVLGKVLSSSRHRSSLSKAST